MTGCMELLRDSGPLPDTVAVLDWLTVNTHGDSSTPLKAFFNILKALEGMLQVIRSGTSMFGAADYPADWRWFHTCDRRASEVSRTRLHRCS